jgi:protocatechuate 3,4-dioxygenase, alpha subunit
MNLPLTPSQTVGPFFHRALLSHKGDDLTTDGSVGTRIIIEGRVLDGDGQPVTDAMVEIWQANAAGRYEHPADPQGKPRNNKFRGFGRVATDQQGRFSFRTIKPGPVREAGDFTQAPHINVTLFARGLLHHLITRIYFPGEPLNSSDPVLRVAPAERQSTLIAKETGSSNEPHYEFDIVLQGDSETVFFDI